MIKGSQWKLSLRTSSIYICILIQIKSISSIQNIIRGIQNKVAFFSSCMVNDDDLISYCRCRLDPVFQAQQKQIVAGTVDASESYDLLICLFA